MGYIAEAIFYSQNTKPEWIPAEIMNVHEGTHYYVHYLGKDKKDDDWLQTSEVRHLDDLSTIRVRVGDSIVIPTSPSSTADSSPTHDTTPVTIYSPIWGSFFQLSQLSKQTTAGSSAYGSSSSAHYDPHEYSPKTIRGVEFINGGLRIKSWYRSPFPPNFWSVDTYLSICQCCLEYGINDESGHVCCCPIGGCEVYSSLTLSVIQFDGSESTDFCVRLFLLSKLFLEDKRTANDDSQAAQITPFLFYCLFEKTINKRMKFVGYFSKYKVQKKDSPILSCILVLPSEQRKGYGKLLISIAYELARREGRQGSAERPLSGPGQAAFMAWWTLRMRNVLSRCFDGELLTISQLSDLSGMTSEDVVETLRNCGALKQWGTCGTDVKLRESGKRAKVRLTMDLYRSLDIKCSKKVSVIEDEFELPLKLNELVRLCPIVQTPTK